MRQESKYHVILFRQDKTYLSHKNFTSYIGAVEWAKAMKDAAIAEIHDRREILFSGKHERSLIARFIKI